MPVAVVAALVAEQFPQWEDLSVTPVVSAGTVNALFRLGDAVILRFPLQPSDSDALRAGLAQEQARAAELAGRTRLAVPKPLGLGEPGPGYRGWWTAYRWIPGEPATQADASLAKDVAFARDLAAFIVAAHGIPVQGRVWDGVSRGGPLQAQSSFVQHYLGPAAGLVDVSRLSQVWQRCLAIPGYEGAPRWLHGDLTPGNLLERDGVLVAVIDVGTDHVGDPALDLMPAWNMLTGAARTSFRDGVGADDATWERGRGWALVQAIGCVAYYRESNPVMAAVARRTLAAVLD